MKKLLLIIIPVTCLLIVGMLPRIAKADIKTGLQGWWKFDEGSGTTPADSSGNGFNGTFNYTSVNPTWVTGKIGPYALNSTQNAGTHAQITTSNNSLLDSTSAITVSTWVKFSTSQTNVGFVSRWGVATSYVLMVSYLNANRMMFLVNNAGTNKKAESVNTYNDGNWHMVTGVYDGANVKIYVDGGTESVTGDALVGGFTSSSDTTALFDYGDSPTNAFVGSMDDVRIYNRALTAADVKELYRYPNTNKIDVSLYGPSTLYSGLVGWWTFDGKYMQNNVVDTSGQGNNGYFSGAGFVSTSSSLVAGKIGQALNVNGAYYVRVNSSSSLNPTAAITASAWFKQPYGACASTCVLLNKGDGSTLGGSQYEFVFNSSNSLRFEISNGSAWITASSGALVADNKWHHVVGTYNGSTVTIYVDGVNKGSTSGAATIQTSTSQLGIGSIGLSQTASLNGLVDDVRIYNRALSTQEIYQLYNTGTDKITTSLVGPGKLNSSLTGWWTMDGKDTNWSTGQVADKSGNGHPISLVNLATTTGVVAGKIGQALSLSGAASTYGILGVAGSALFNAGSGSISTWVYPIAGGGVCSSLTAAAFLTDNQGSGFWNIGYDGSNICGGINDAANESVSAAVTAKRWYHVVLTWNGTSETLYLNGASTTSHTAGNVSNLTSTVNFGRGSGGSYLTAYEDDVRTYNRALSAQEVYDLFKLGKNK